MSIIRVSAKLDRTDSQTPWGFRMVGGKDYHSPLVIQKINPGSLSSKCGIKENDVITHIGGFGVAHLTHREAQDLIIGSGNNLELKLERSSGGSSHNNSVGGGSDGYFQQQQPSSLPWQQPQQQQPHRPGPGLYNFAPKPFQRSGDVTTITSHVASLNVRNAPHPIQDNLIDTNGDKEKLPTPLDGESPPLSIRSTNEMQDNTPPGKSLPKIERSNAGIQLADNPPTDLKNTNLEKSIGRDQPDSTNESEDVKSHGSQLENADQSKEPYDPLESRRIFSRRASDLQPQSKSFMKLRGLLDGGNSKDCQDDNGSIVRQTSINDKPQISAKPKLVPPPKPKPLASSNRSDSPAKDPVQSKLSEDDSNRSGSSPQIKPDSNKPLPQPDSPPIKIVPPTRPKPPFKQYNSPIGLYSKQAQTEAELSKYSDSSRPHPQLPIKEASSGDDVVIAVPSQRKTITIQNNKNRVESPSSHVTAPEADEIVVQSLERKQIVVKSKSVNTSSTPPTSRSNSSEIDLNGNKTAAVSCAPTGPCDVIYGSEKAKIIIKKRESTNEKQHLMDFTLEDLGLSDAVVVGISLPDHMRECLPSSDADVTESRSQIKVVPRAAHSTQHRFGSPPQHHLPGPRSPPTSGGIVWRPHIPIGERKMKIGRPGQAQRRPPMSGSARIPICATCHTSIRGPYVTALDKTWCPDHFVCANPNCSQPLFDCGFVEEADHLYCEKDYEKYLAPRCARCSGAIVGEVVNAMKNTYHVQCFVCAACHQPIGTGSFHNEDGKIYCAKDWGLMFQTKCYGCQFPIETGDRWVEALSQNWHSECFNCSTCQINLEGQSFCAKNGKPYCKKHGALRGF